MLTPTLIQRYLQSEGPPDTTSPAYQNHLHVLTSLLQAEKLAGVPVLFFGAQHYISLFADNGWVAAQTIYKHKSIIRPFINWLRFEPEGIAVAVPEITDTIALDSLTPDKLVSSATIRRTFFESALAFHACLTDLFGDDEGIYTQRYLMEKLYYALLWEGVPRNVIPLLSRRLADATAATLVFDGVTYALAGSYTRQYVLAAAASDFYKDQLGRKRHYAQTGLLLRNTDASLSPGQPVSASTLGRYSNTQQRLARALPMRHTNHGRYLNARTVVLNGSFWRLHNDLGAAPAKSASHTVNKRFCEYKGRQPQSITTKDVRARICYTADFQHWRRVFFPQTSTLREDKRHEP